MKHVLFAEFPDEATVQEALRDLADEGVRESRVHVDLRYPQAPGTVDNEEERPLNQTDTRSGMLLGLVLAAVVGSAMGWLVVGPLGLFQVDLWTGMITGFLLGLAIGLIGGVISGAMNPNRQLDTMEHRAEQRGGVVATVEVEGAREQESVERVFHAHGATVERRTV